MINRLKQLLNSIELKYFKDLAAFFLTGESIYLPQDWPESTLLEIEEMYDNATPPEAINAVNLCLYMEGQRVTMN